MKRLFFSVLSVSIFFTLVSMGMMNQSSLNDVKTDKHSLPHHTCSGTSFVGGTCSATCTDSQGCACNSYYFSCTCGCTSQETAQAPINEIIEAGPKENWEAVAGLLRNTNNPSAVEMSVEVMKVYYLANSNPREFNRRAVVLDQKLDALPNSIKKQVFALAK